MKAELEVLGIDKDGVNYSVVYNWSNDDTDEIRDLHVNKFN